MSLTINAKTYTPDSYGINAVGYVGPAKTVSLKDDVSLKRTSPKPTSVFSGVGRTQAKLTRTLVLTGALTTSGDAILSIDMSAPVGAASADLDAFCADMGAYVASASFKTLIKNLQITY